MTKSDDSFCFVGRVRISPPNPLINYRAANIRLILVTDEGSFRGRSRPGICAELATGILSRGFAQRLPAENPRGFNVEALVEPTRGFRPFHINPDLRRLQPRQEKNYKTPRIFS